MLEIITGRAGSGKTTYCLNEICKELKKRPLGPAIILLLPEHMTYKVERELVSMLPEQGNGYMRCRVYGFKRFAYQILQETGGGLKKGISDLGRQLLLKRILDSRRKELTVFGRAAGQRGFSSVLSGIIDEFKSYDISPELLAKTSEHIEDKRLNQKLTDLSLLYADFNAAMAESYTDGKDIMNILVDKIPASATVAGAEVWLDGFLFFNPLEMQVLEGLFRYARDIHVTFNMDDMNTAHGQWTNVEAAGLFNRAYTARNRLVKLAQRLDISVEYRHFTGGARFVNPVLKEIEASFDQRRVGRLDKAEDISVVEAATSRLEVEAAAADIIHLVKDRKYKWRDIGVLIRDWDSYGDLVKFVFKDYDIPYFSDKKRQCANHPVAELIRSAISVVGGGRYTAGWQYEDIFCCIKTGFFHLTYQQIDLLENYCLEFVLKGARVWQQEAPWEYFSRYSIDNETEQISEAQQLRSGTADQLRRLVAEPLTKLQNGLGQGRTARTKIMALYEFLMELEVPQTLQEWADKAVHDGDLDFAREHQQVWNDIMEMLDQLVEVSGETVISNKELLLLLEEGLSALEMALIPPGLDYVNIASFDQNSLDNIRAVYILGANAGIMPRRPMENIVLSDVDRLHINQKNIIELSLLGEEASFNEGYLIYKAFTQAREYMWVSYALSTAAGEAVSGAEIVGKIRELLPRNSLKTISLDWMETFSENDQLFMLVRPRQSLSALAAALRKLRDTGELPPLWQQVYNGLRENTKVRSQLDLVREGLFFNSRLERLPQNIAKALYAKNGWLTGSVTSFEGYNKCPFQYFAQHGLKLRERKINRFTSPELGTLLHGVFREFGEKLKAANRHWSDLTAAERDSLCHDILHKLAPRLNNGMLYSSRQLEIQLKRLEKTAKFALERLCEFDRVSKFSPQLFERSFGRSFAADDTLQVVYQLHGGTRLELVGQIDRIDLSEDGQYFMVMDYKTGYAAINMVEVYYGLRLQLLTYLLVAAQLLAKGNSGKALPAGMLYFFLKKPMVKMERHCQDAEKIRAGIDKELRMPGWILMDKAVVQQIDSMLGAGESSRFIKVGLKKDGDFDRKSLKILKSQEEFQLLMEYVELIFQDTGHRIMDGHIEIEPYRLQKMTPCRYCKYHPLCGFEPQLPGYDYKRLTIDEAGAIEAVQERIDANKDNDSGEGK